MFTLITGITGLLGSALAETNKRLRRIKGVYVGNYNMPDTKLISYSICDVTDKESLLNLFKNDGIDCIIHTAGIADTDFCEREPNSAFVSNVVGTKNIIELAKMKGAKVIYISTNAVFDGQDAPYGEEDKTNPINKYGAQKLECEYLVRNNLKNHLIIRPILMYGLNNPHERKCFLMRILEKLSAGEEINIVDDVYENPLLSYECARLIWKLINQDARGIYHIAGRDVLSRYEAAKLAARAFSLNTGLIRPVPSAFFSNLAPRPKNTSYKTGKIEKELGERPIGLEEGLSIVKNIMSNSKEILTESF